MTEIVWPKELPQVLMSDGLSATKKNCIVRTEMDAGPVKQRRRYTVATKEFTGSIICNEEQRLRLERFYDEEIGSGALRFVMRDSQTLKPAEFRFLEAPTEDNADGLWKITLKLEKMNA